MGDSPRAALVAPATVSQRAEETRAPTVHVAGLAQGEGVQLARAELEHAPACQVAADRHRSLDGRVLVVLSGEHAVTAATPGIRDLHVSASARQDTSKKCRRAYGWHGQRSKVWQRGGEIRPSRG
jgi:hypothetical protein